MNNFLKLFSILFFLSFTLCSAYIVYAQNHSLNNLLTDEDAVIISDKNGKIIFSKNSSKKLVPASTLKVLTSLAAIHFLGSDFRFKTEFHMDNNSNLKIKGFGDPLMISEIVEEISSALCNNLKKNKIVINNIILDDSYFDHLIKIPGTNLSDQPYDAPNGALCVNFNTFYFKRFKNSYISAEAQTPLLSCALKKIRKTSSNSGRIVFSHNKNEYTLYAGEMFLFFLKKHGAKITGNIKTGHINKKDRLILVYESNFSLSKIISKLLEYSNNFMANQLFITMGANLFGPPGTIEKGKLALLDYADQTLGIKDINIVEGSGISRQNKISAMDMDKILSEFKPYRKLMRTVGNEYYKTGTLNGIATRVGYIDNGKEDISRYVILLNRSGKSMGDIMKLVRDIFNKKQYPKQNSFLKKINHLKG